MNKIKLVLVRSFVVLPLLGTALAGNPILSVSSITPGVVLQDNKIELSEVDLAQAAKIDAFFAARNWPLEGHGKKMVEVAKENRLNPYLLPAIAARESSGGLHACKNADNSVFGFGGCKMSFKSIDESIEIVGAHLGGNNPKTERYYKDKDLTGILKSYNSAIPQYKNQVVKIMKTIENQVVANSDIAEAPTTGQS